MPRQRLHAIALALGLALALTACGGSTDDPAAPPAGSTPTATEDDSASTSTTDPGTTSTAPHEDEDMTSLTPIPDPAPREGALPTGPVPDGVAERPAVAAAIEDYAQRAGVDASEVTVEGFAEVTWSDGSLGCPQPGMMYTMALVPGYQLVLGADGRLASYHAAREGAFSYCANPVPPSETASTS